MGKDESRVKLVIIETPYRARSKEELRLHLRYARACMADSLSRGEAPFASHLLYTQPGILDDNIPSERDLGIRAGFEWSSVAHLRAVYTDLGISGGMHRGIKHSQDGGVAGIDYTIRQIPGPWAEAKERIDEKLQKQEKRRSLVIDKFFGFVLGKLFK